MLLEGRERVVVKRTALDLIRECFPEQVLATVHTLWNGNVVPNLAQYSLEVLAHVDPDSGLSVALHRGIAAKRIGVRVSSCAALSEMHSAPATNALLELLQNDDSMWVRIQALRSLCAPGRNVAREDILNASKEERSSRVLG